MIFTSGQLLVLIIFTEFMIYGSLELVTSTIKHCATARAYRKAMERGVATLDDSWFASFKQNKEEKEDGNN